jgi:hypothetical protein
MQRLLIHIGFHKTGTTYLQEHIFREHNGFAPGWTVFSGEAVEHFVLCHPLRFDPDRIREAFEATHEPRRDTLLPVLSHEDLSGHPVKGRYYGVEVAHRLCECFESAKVLIGIREQQSALRSLFGEYIRQDGEWPIDVFVGRGDEPPGFAPICRLDHLEYDLLVGHYQSLFGAANVLVLPFEQLRNDPLGYEQRIHDFCGTGRRATTVHPPARVGYRAATLAVHRWLNRAVRKSPLRNEGWSTTSTAFRVKQRICRVLDQVAPCALDQWIDGRIRQFIVRRVAHHYRESNRRLSAMIGMDLAALGYDA